MSNQGNKVHDSLASQCLSCYLKALCLPPDLTPEQFDSIIPILDAPIRLDKRDHLVQQGVAFRYLFAVRTGSLKQVTADTNSDTLLTAVYLPGDLIGFDAIGPGHYPGSIVALELSSVCRLPFERLDELGTRMPILRRHLQRNISRTMQEERLRLHQLLSRTAEARLAYFLMSLSECFRRRGYSSRHFRLAMSRSDIGSYLGLTHETVGRTLATFQAQQLLDVKARDYHLLDMAGLERLASSTGRRQKRA
ncbi:helix-turn-helix domain-containing protein [Billgrantia lactosivorans]|uniref:helix-turn-helix domain-containing protein n=1 Tax=Billgrantia lactosivorans TaxID=2185141 RepID=UPI000DADAA96|nr:helix-turn-helix domain-containing protein [Halomonas lactosivorans]